MRITRKFYEAVKLADRPAYKIAQEAKVDPGVLSGILTGRLKVWPNDRRVIAVGKVLGLSPEECLESSRKRPAPSTLLTREEEKKDKKK